MKLFYEYMAIFLNLSPTSSHLYPLQAENCDSNSRLVVDKDDNGKYKLEWVNKKVITDLFVIEMINMYVYVELRWLLF